MYPRILQLNFKFNSSPTEYKQAVSPLATAVASVPVCRWKIWILDEENNEAGGIYLFGDEASVQSYLEGLREAGWRGDARLARLGYTTSLALRFAPLLGWFDLAVPTEDGRARLRSFYSQSLEEVADRIAAIRRFALSRVQETRALLLALEQ